MAVAGRTIVTQNSWFLFLLCCVLSGSLVSLSSIHTQIHTHAQTHSIGLLQLSCVFTSMNVAYWLTYNKCPAMGAKRYGWERQVNNMVMLYISSRTTRVWTQSPLMTRFSETEQERERESVCVCEREKGSREKRVCIHMYTYTHTHSLRDREREKSCIWRHRKRECIYS